LAFDPAPFHIYSVETAPKWWILEPSRATINIFTLVSLTEKKPSTYNANTLLSNYQEGAHGSSNADFKRREAFHDQQLKNFCPRIDADFHGLYPARSVLIRIAIWRNPRTFLFFLLGF
jgi:hypothetical protein